MADEAKHSPVLWSAIVIPLVSATELFVDPATRNSYDVFVLASFYLISVRYSLAVCLGVFAHNEALESARGFRAGALLWVCYFSILVFCSLLVPGAAIIGLYATLTLAFAVVGLSVIQGALHRRFAGDAAVKKDIGWRIGGDILVLGALTYEVCHGRSFQSVCFGLVFLLFMDFTINEFAKSTLRNMLRALVDYFRLSLASSGSG